MSKPAVSRFYHTLLKKPPPRNETEVEYLVLGPVIEKLGWDLHEQVEWRYQVGETPRSGIVDVALHAGDEKPLEVPPHPGPKPPIRQAVPR